MKSRVIAISIFLLALMGFAVIYLYLSDELSTNPQEQVIQTPTQGEYYVEEDDGDHEEEHGEEELEED